MHQIIEVDPDDMTAVVQPGLLNVTLAKAASDAGLFYAPDPASFEICSIGGNLATKRRRSAHEVRRHPRSRRGARGGPGQRDRSCARAHRILMASPATTS